MDNHADFGVARRLEDISAEEQKALIDFVLALRKSHIHDFLKQVELPSSGTKEELRERIQNNLDDGSITYEQLVGLLDSVAPWGKQHVFLYHGPRQDIQAWKNPDYVLQLLKQHRLGKFLNSQLPLGLATISQHRPREHSIAHRTRD